MIELLNLREVINKLSTGFAQDFWLLISIKVRYNLNLLKFYLLHL